MSYTSYKTKNNYMFANECKGTRNGFKHTSILYNPDGIKVCEHTCHYINRTWEPFAFYTSMICAVEDAEDEIKQLITNKVKEQMQIKRLTKQYKPIVEKMINENVLLQEYAEVKDYIKKSHSVEEGRCYD